MSATSAAASSRVCTNFFDPLYHPLGSTVDRGRPDPADLCGETLAAYRATLILGRSRAPP